MQGEPIQLEVHHLRYRDWQEEPEDLLVLCEECHERHHAIDSLGRPSLRPEILAKWCRLRESRPRA
jgi:5-methylcytosine-specific restriction endonuclease McrA